MRGAHRHPISPPDICRWCSPEQAARYLPLADILTALPNVRFRG